MNIKQLMLAGKHAYGLVPASMSVTELSQHDKTGGLNQKKLRN